MRGRGAKRRTASEYFQVSKELWGTCLARQTRQFEIRTRKSQSAGMESVRNHDHCFLTCCQKASKWGSEKWSLNRPIQARYFFESCSLLDPSKSKVQTASRQKRWGTLHIPLAKINYSPDGGRRTKDGHQIIWCPRTERALRAIISILNNGI